MSGRHAGAVKLTPSNPILEEHLVAAQPSLPHRNHCNGQATQVTLKHWVDGKSMSGFGHISSQAHQQPLFRIFFRPKVIQLAWPPMQKSLDTLALKVQVNLAAQLAMAAENSIECEPLEPNLVIHHQCVQAGSKLEDSQLSRNMYHCQIHTPYTGISQWARLQVTQLNE
jgi:hypothetical protein